MVTLPKRPRGRPKKIKVHVDDNPSESVDNSVNLVLKVNDTEYKTSGATILEALNAIPLDWIQIQTAGTFIISQGSNKMEKFVWLRPLRLLFGNPEVRAFQARNFESLLGANESQ